MEIIVGSFMTIAVFNIIFYFYFQRRVVFLFLFLYCTINIFKINLVQSVIYGEATRNYSYISDVWLMELYAYIGSYLLLGFLLLNYSIPKYKLWVSIWSFVLFSFYFLNLKTPFLILSVFAGFLVAIYALFKSKEDALLGFSGLCGFSILSVLGSMRIVDYGYFIGIVWFILCMTLSFGGQFSRKKSQYNEAIVRSSRLESELLRRHIRPHFLMNSLMTLQELLVKNPDDAGVFIENLAEQFRLFSSASEKSLVPVNDELLLCQSYLKIMGWRRATSFCLEVTGFDGTEKVPPAIIHTLVENGVTHGYRSHRKGIFKLSKELLENQTVFTLWNNSDLSGGSSNTGTGLKYVKDRLEESYPSRWSLNSFATLDGWQVDIRITSEQTQRW